MDEHEKQDLFNEGLDLLGQNKYEESLDLFENILKKDPSYERAIINKCFILAELKSIPDSLNYLNDQIKRYSEYYNLFFLKASLLNELERYSESIHYYDLAVEKGIEEDFVYYGQAYNYLALEDNKNAVFYFEKHLENNPEDAESWSKLGYCLPFLGEFDKAMECNDRAIELDPNSYLAYFSKAAILRAKKEYEMAIDCFKKAHELDPDEADTLLNIKRCLVALGRYEEAKEYEKIIKNFPSSAIYLESQLEEKIYNDPSILKKYGYDVEHIEQQYTIKDQEGKTRFIDLIFKDRKTNESIVIELKNVKATLKTYNQIDNYLKSLKENYQLICKGIVIARGYEPNFINLINERDDIEFIYLEELGYE
ncbi:DUF1016 family protein [Methanobacterium alkalithermotolerans]|uniref:DUF1016 family protein n=1 Tax=Methanobacterium alkalithermotolerans TaxID=2731220 RepID=A0A8T8K6E8_9EURY|nr:endonuclease NucS domain-containing protein [Methanobacterium alkalithermotolerans]QUH24208.1 DUF1016 family protein [Methanobacterium alkalithermotolerans]